MQRDRRLLRRVGNAVNPAPCFKGRSAIGRGEIGSKTLRFQVHALGHVIAPGAHRLAEDAERKSGIAQMGRERKSIGSGADYGNVTDVGHDILMKQWEFGAIPVFRIETKLSL